MKRRGEGHLDTFTESQLLHVLADLFGAGTDTSMTIIKWVLLYMILYPDLQVRLLHSPSLESEALYIKDD